jgi:cytochrome b6-f complex iron-sulfur subunit
VVFEQRVLDGYMERIVQRRLALVRDKGAASGLSALSTTCTHLGCGVAWSDERKAFLCPCHGGVYAEDGSVLAGPPPRPLERLAVLVDGGRLRVVPEKARAT